MNITIYAVGKIKENFYREAVEEYARRLGRYCTLKIVEVADEKTPVGAGAGMARQIKDREGERLLGRIREDTYLIALAIDGKRMDSITFAQKLGGLGLDGKSKVGFVIGGSLGLSEKILARADARLSFSDLTFPHQLMRVIVLEQIYRAFRILGNEPYHK